MTRLEQLRAQFDEVTGLIAASADVDAEEWSPEWMTRQSLLQSQSDLAHQIRLHEGNSEVELRLVGGAETRHEIDAQFFGHVLQHLQGAVSGMVQTLMRGVSPGRGKYPLDVVRASELKVAALRPGSFVVHLSGPERAQQLALDKSPPPPFDEALERVLDLFDAATLDPEDEDLENAIGEVRSTRALVHISEIAKALARTDTTASITERSPFADRPREATVTARAARRLQGILSHTRQETEQVYYVGILSGVRWTRGIFDLEVARDHETEVISGRVRSDLRPYVSAVFDRRVRAELERTYTWTGLTDEPSVTWLLTDVTEVNAE